MTNLTKIEATHGTLQVRVALHGRRALNSAIGTQGLVAGLSRFEKVFGITAASRTDPATHNKVRSTLVQMIEDLIDGRVSFQPASLPDFMCYGVAWCILNHDRDATASRRSVLTFLNQQGNVHLDLMTTANDQMALTTSARSEAEVLRGALASTSRGTRIGLVVDDLGLPFVTAYEEARVH